MEEQNKKLRHAKETADSGGKKTYTAELFLTGDALIHDSVYQAARQEDGSYDFSRMLACIGKLAEGYDLKYYNQETILGGTELGLSSYPLFNSPREMGDAMVKMGFNLVSTANNHSLDKGLPGIANSLRYWAEQEREHGVHTAGTSLSRQAHDAIPVYEINGITYTFLSWTYWCNSLQPPKGFSYIVNSYEHGTEEMLDQIRRADRLSDIVIVAMHWGDENTMELNGEQIELAQKLADCGADIIIGNHPHAIQPIAWLNDHKTLCFYAMGNMLSGQMAEITHVGMVGGLTIEKHVLQGSATVTLKDPRVDLIWTAHDAQRRQYKVIPMKELDDAIVSNGSKLYERYRTRITDWNAEVRFGVELKR